MNLKRGIVVSHMSMNEWGAGMVVAVSDGKATIQFSDGIIRKIAASHYTTLLPADPASNLPPPEIAPATPAVRVLEYPAAEYFRVDSRGGWSDHWIGLE